VRFKDCIVSEYGGGEEDEDEVASEFDNTASKLSGLNQARSVVELLLWATTSPQSPADPATKPKL